MSGSSRGQMYDAFGAYVRSQRQLAKLTLRQVAELASISNPYLSQIEHGVTLPSIAVISALAEALSVSAETLLLQAAGVASPGADERASHTEDAIRQDPRLDDAQKHALLAVLTSFVGSSSPAKPAELGHGKPAVAPRATSKPARRTTRPATAATAAPRRKRTSP
ncbi:MAG: helix-turn-helix domain-containing protein [Acidimicrobiales bacterium]